MSRDSRIVITHSDICIRKSWCTHILAQPEITKFDMIIRQKYWQSVPYSLMHHSPFSGFRSRWRTWYLPIASVLPLIRAPPALLRSAGQWQWCKAWVIWRNIFQILSSCNETPERVAFRIREPRSPDLQYYMISRGNHQLKPRRTSMTIYIRSFFGSLIFWTSCTILRCLSPSRILLLLSDTEIIKENCSLHLS